MVNKSILITVLVATAVSVLGFYSMNHKKNTPQLNAIPDLRVSFMKWKTTYNKKYSTPREEIHRMSTFVRNYFKIQREKRSGITHDLALNQFADLSAEEFSAKYFGLNPKPRKQSELAQTLTDIPSSVDWREKGAVTPVKNQGSCGSCWAFSAIAALESAAVINAQAPLQALSEQQLVDCATAEGNQGCQGGWMDFAFDYIIKVGGIESETDYPYKAEDLECKADSSKFTGVRIQKYEDIAKGDCKGLQQAIALQPVSVAVAANAFQFYSKGVFSTLFCGSGLNHGVVAEGYGTDNGKDFWLVRNSWGEKWGEAGYIRLNRAIQISTGMCGICEAASYPIATTSA